MSKPGFSKKRGNPTKETKTKVTIPKSPASISISKKRPLSSIEQVSFSLPNASQTQDVTSARVSDLRDYCPMHVPEEDVEDTESDEDDEEDEDYLPTHLRTTTLPNT